jgi:hypothetical protein
MVEIRLEFTGETTACARAALRWLPRLKKIAILCAICDREAGLFQKPYRRAARRANGVICTLLVCHVTEVLVQADSTSISVSQALLLSIALILLFAVQVYTAGITARKLDVFDVSYGRALWATVLVGVSSIVIQALFVELLALSQFVMVLALMAVPVLIYRLVFTCTVKQAIVIWIVVVAVGLLAGIALVLGALSLGAWLDSKFDLPMVPTLSYVPTLEGA